MTAITDRYISLLKLYSRPNGRTHVKKIHAFLLKTLEPWRFTFLYNNLVIGYAKSGHHSYARKAFDEIPSPNLVSYNALLSACSKSGCLSDMRAVFDSMLMKDGISWNTLISGYGAHGSCAWAVEAYQLMLQEALSDLNEITFSTMLMLSSSYSSIRLGRQIHCHIVKHGFGLYTFVGSTLVDMYSKLDQVDDAKKVFNGMEEKNTVVCNTMITGLLRSGRIEESRRLFDEMPKRDSVSWTTMVTGLKNNGMEVEAVDLFREMRSRGIDMDQYTFGSVLTSCSSLQALKEGKQIHAYIIRTHFDDNVFVGSALVDMYSKCAVMRSAESVFVRMETKNIISWTAMLVGYGQNGCSEEAVRTFRDMQDNGVWPDDYTLGSVISSCGNLASLEEGMQFHCCALVSGLISYLTVSNALVTLYGKCGGIMDSHRLFDEMKIRDQVSWTALVWGYAQFGKAEETVLLFERMLMEGIKPDGVTFIGVLSACSHAGLVEKGEMFFKAMVDEHGIAPEAEHYACMIDLFSRSRRLKEAESFIRRMPCSPDAIGWSTLLSSCRLQGNMEIGRWAAESLLELDPQNPAGYVLLTQMHASRGEWNEVAQLRMKMHENRVKKEPGFSWIKYKNKVHIFSAEDRSHPYSELLYAKLDEINEKMVEEGYEPDVSSVLHDVARADKLDMLGHHSERLAIAFGLLHIPRGMPIRVVKNLRVCVDCHNATKIISKIYGREILVRDAVRFHSFGDGMCSCRDFW